LLQQTHASMLMDYIDYIHSRTAASAATLA